MKRFRLSTLMLLVIIAALAVALVAQGRRAAVREEQLRAQLAQARMELLKERDLAVERQTK
jgi:hypothetical protein